MEQEFVECEHCGCKVSYEEYISDDSGSHFYCPECWAALNEAEEAEEKKAYDRLKLLESILDNNDVEYTVQAAQTRSMYFNCNYAPVVGIDADGDDVYGDSIEFKVRYSDHSQCYDADLNVAMTESNADGCTIESFDKILKSFLKNNCNK